MTVSRRPPRFAIEAVTDPHFDEPVLMKPVIRIHVPQALIRSSVGRTQSWRGLQRPVRSLATVPIDAVLRNGLVIVLTAMSMIAGGCSGTTRESVLEQLQLTEVRVALARQEFERAERLAKELASKATLPNLRLEAQLLAGQASLGRGRHETALAEWESIGRELTGVPADPQQARMATEAAWRAGQVLLHQQHRAAAAEERFRRALAISPDELPALSELAYLLAVEGRRFEAIPFILRRMRAGEVDLDQLALLGKPFGNINDAKLLEACQRVDRLQPTLLLGLASSAAFGLKPEQRRLLLSEVVDTQPMLLDAQVRLGKQLYDERDQAAFLRWHAKLPSEADENSEIWAIRGDWALRQAELPVARRCYGEAIKRDPNHRGALYQLGRLLLQSGPQDVAQRLLDRSAKLATLREREDVLFYSEHVDVEPIRAVAEPMFELGRLWEAWGWSRIALQQQPDAIWASEMVQRLTPRLKSLPPLTIEAANPVRDWEFASLPRPAWTILPEPQQLALPSNDAPIRFTEEAASVGLDFRYFADGRSATEGKRMFEFTGGGVAVLDFDHDTWPDCYWTQGSHWPSSAAKREHLDRLVRNLDGQKLVDITSQAWLVEPSYSQGVTVGDYDSDGFPDLYIANIGRNRLFHNNGDGTFSDVSAQVSGDLALWTTSCLLADLTGDGLPDLYDVNYATGKDVYERVCTHPDGKPRQCMPFHFPSAPDQVYENQGDGRFVAMPAEPGGDPDDGRGLGIVAADFDQSGRLSLFIANDTSPNFLLLNQAPQPPDRPSASARSHAPLDASGKAADAGQETVQSRPAQGLFREQGVASGLACNGQGRAEGCMGIAVGDADQDGLFDLFVTNFFHETNTLYRQESAVTFFDVTADFGLAEPSYEMLGFGTQFLDADLDGDDDLIVTNGHVDDLRAHGRPYQMRPQVFAQTAPGQFHELPADKIGPFFAGNYLGRGLARWDFNRDGREDILISHLDRPPALLINRSPQAAHFLAIALRGTRSSREPIGAQVRVELADRTLVRQLTAGDGYQASNERRLVFGLGTATEVKQLEIRWPAGQVETFSNLAADQSLLFVEADPRSPF